MRFHFLQNTSSGSVCCNDVIVQLSVETLPFGGVGESGYGGYHGELKFKNHINWLNIQYPVKKLTRSLLKQ